MSYPALLPLLPLQIALLYAAAKNLENSLQNYSRNQMCRMIGAAGNFDKDAVINAAATMSKCLIGTHEHKGWTHDDGWGASFLTTEKELKCVRDEKPFTIEAARLQLAEASGGLLVIHARRASNKAQLGTEFVHPIECLIADRKAYFFHNGFFADSEELLGKKIEWDTAALLELLLPAFRAEDRHAETTKVLAGLSKKTTSVNFLLAEPDRLTACNWFIDAKHPDYYTMHLLRTADATLVSSEAIPHLAPHPNWQAVPNRSVLSFSVPASQAPA